MAVAADLDRATDSSWDGVAEQTRTYVASGGSEGHESDGLHILVLATTGRRTGQPRRTCLIYGTRGDELVVVASKGGADEDPDWFQNLRSDPSAGVQVGANRFTARARTASDAERDTVADDGAHLPVVRRVRAHDPADDPDRDPHSARLIERPHPANDESRTRKSQAR